MFDVYYRSPHRKESHFLTLLKHPKCRPLGALVTLISAERGNKIKKAKAQIEMQVAMGIKDNKTIVLETRKGPIFSLCFQLNDIEGEEDRLCRDG